MRRRPTENMDALSSLAIRKSEGAEGAPCDSDAYSVACKVRHSGLEIEPSVSVDAHLAVNMTNH